MIPRFVSPAAKMLLTALMSSVMATTVLAESPKVDETALTIIGYHEITDHRDALIPSYAVSEQQFSQHIDWLKNNGFHFIFTKAF